MTTETNSTPTLRLEPTDGLTLLMALTLAENTVIGVAEHCDGVGDAEGLEAAVEARSRLRNLLRGIQEAASGAKSDEVVQLAGDPRDLTLIVSSLIAYKSLGRHLLATDDSVAQRRDEVEENINRADNLAKRFAAFLNAAAPGYCAGWARQTAAADSTELPGWHDTTDLERASFAEFNALIGGPAPGSSKLQ